MHFTEDVPSGNYIISEYTPESVTINKQYYENSLYVSPNTLISDIPLKLSADLSINSVQFIIDLKPELLILGTGPTLKFPAPSVIACFAEHKIGFETMDHSAACRTFAILAAEQRNVGLLLLLDPKV